MTFSSKFSIGAEVYFYSEKSHKVEVGIIDAIGMHANEKRCDFNYYIKPINSKSFLTECVNGSLVFKDRDDVFRFVYSIA